MMLLYKNMKKPSKEYIKPNDKKVKIRIVLPFVASSHDPFEI